MKVLKKSLAAVIAVLMISTFFAFGTSATSGTRYGGLDYSSVFNAQYYANKYGDLRAAFGNNSAALFRHFINNGMNEGRQASEDFDFWYYYNNNWDLRNAFGNNKGAYYRHYITNGAREGRVAAPAYIYNGVDYSKVYNYEYYRNKYWDLNAAFGNNVRAYIAHFVSNGMNEGRQASEDFDFWYYYNDNWDLRNAFGNNKTAYYMHYITNGAREGRVAAPAYIYNGVDYGKVYNYEYYRNKYGDLNAAFGNNVRAYIAHFVNNGMNEGRQASENFRYDVYANRYGDLRAAFGTNKRAYYMHYITNGAREGRFGGTGTVFEGVDYSRVYNYDYYISNNPDVVAAFGTDPYYAIRHFVLWGMREGRRGSRNFDVDFYRNADRNKDLVEAFGDKTEEYYMHYINWGYDEGRPASGNLTGIDVSRHNGEVNWDAVKNAGIQFAMIRVGYGDDLSNQDDIQAVRNMQECERLGIPYGVYLYSYATNTDGAVESAVSEANHVKRMIAGHNPQLGIWYDMEDDCQDKLSNEQLADIAVRFLEEMRPCGYDLGIYASLNFWNTRLNSARLDGYKRWVAQWADECTYNGTYHFWQYTSKGIVDGIEGNVDMDIWYK